MEEFELEHFTEMVLAARLLLVLLTRKMARQQEGGYHSLCMQEVEAANCACFMRRGREESTIASPQQQFPQCFLNLSKLQSQVKSVMKANHAVYAGHMTQTHHFYFLAQNDDKTRLVLHQAGKITTNSSVFLPKVFS